MLPRSTADLYRANQRRVARAIAAARAEWDATGSVAGLERLVPRLTLLLAASMVGAARDGAASVDPALAETGFEVTPVAAVMPQAFARSASDGRPLESLLLSPVIVARSSGVDAGRVVLDRIVHTQIGDATRMASQVAITARPGVGWVRMVNPPCCQDCAVQAGKWFRYNQGFKRHPNCDCVHRPAHESEPPSGYTQAVDPDQIHDLTNAQRQALTEGADLSRVVNAYRRVERHASGRAVSGARRRMTTTTELVGRPGARLTPDGIYQQARTRAEAVALLRRHGYLV